MTKPEEMVERNPKSLPVYQMARKGPASNSMMSTHWTMRVATHPITQIPAVLNVFLSMKNMIIVMMTITRRPRRR